MLGRIITLVEAGSVSVADIEARVSGKKNGASDKKEDPRVGPVVAKFIAANTGAT